MSSLIVVLFFTVVCCVTQASLYRWGVGRVDRLGDTPLALVLMLISIPLSVLSTMGAIVISIWALFVLPALPTVVTLVLGFVVYGSALGYFYARIRRSGEGYTTLLAFGVPLALAAELGGAIGTAYLAVRFWTHNL